jgi:hypothetical protein
MEFKLFYKSYDYKPSLAAIKQFKEATGLDLWSSLIKYMVCFTQSRANSDSVGDMIHKLSSVLDFVQSAQLFYCLAKQSNSRLSIDEIEDAMFHAGILPSNEDTGLCEPYPIIMYKIALDVQEYHATLSNEKKPQAHS